jgi:hypothetical protein
MAFFLPPHSNAQLLSVDSSRGDLKIRFIPARNYRGSSFVNLARYGRVAFDDDDVCSADRSVFYGVYRSSGRRIEPCDTRFHCIDKYIKLCINLPGRRASPDNASLSLLLSPHQKQSHDRPAAQAVNV